MKKTSFLIVSFVGAVVLLGLVLLGINLFTGTTPEVDSYNPNFQDIKVARNFKYDRQTYAFDDDYLTFNDGISVDNGRLLMSGLRLLKATGKNPKRSIFAVDGVSKRKLIIISDYQYRKHGSNKASTTSSQLRTSQSYDSLAASFELLAPSQVRVMTMGEHIKQNDLSKKQAEQVLSRFQQELLQRKAELRKLSDKERSQTQLQLQLSNRQWALEIDLDLLKLDGKEYLTISNGSDASKTELWPASPVIVKLMKAAVK